jgi:hypothetical protein
VSSLQNSAYYKGPVLLSHISEAIKKNPVKLETLSQVACHPPLPTEVGTHMRKNFRWANTPPIIDVIKEKQH